MKINWIFICLLLCRSARFLKHDGAKITLALDELPSDLDISGVSDGSDNDKIYLPRGEAVPDDSSDKEEEPPMINIQYCTSLVVRIAIPVPEKVISPFLV